MVSGIPSFSNLGALTSKDGDPDKVAIIDLGTGQERRFSYRDFETQANAVARALTALGLARGDRVELRGFGAFSVKHRPARAGRNPRTGAHVPVDQKSVPFFKTGKEMRERLNRDEGAPEAGA